MEDVCGFCGFDMDEAYCVGYTATCGHRHHFSCLRELYEQGKLQCRVCGAVGNDFVDEGTVSVLHEEANFQDKDLELCVSAELRLSRPVTLLTKIPEMVLGLDGLRCLDLTGHPITLLPPDIGRMKSLTRIVLLSLYIEELPEEILQLTHLEQLYVSGCNLKSLPTNLSHLLNLWTLYLDSNQLRALPELLPPQLNGLKISGNLIEELPPLEQYPLTEIRAHANLLTKVPVAPLPLVRHVTLMGNRLTKLPDMGASGLASLLVADNYLTHLPESLCDLQSLEWLYAYNNQLVELPSGLLRKSKSLSRFLIEANPLSQTAVCDLLQEIPSRVRVLGIDTQQVSEYRGPPLPKCVVVGRMLPWGRLYAKLTSSSQLLRCAGVVEERCAKTLVVAFSASQGEPEWAGSLGQVAGQDVAVRARIVRQSGSLAQLRQGRGTEIDVGLSSLAALWEQCSAQSEPPEPVCQLQDFDFLSLCDTNAQWYLDIPEPLRVEEKLQGLLAGYQRVLFLGVSMGGFGALSHAHLADTVAVFGPQTDLCLSHLRPGLSPADMTAASASMQANVSRALARGTRIDYHVAMEDHLLYARLLPLPPGSLVVHPVQGRIARLMERAHILVPLLVDLVAEVQDGPRPWPGSVDVATPATLWEWNDRREHPTVARWVPNGLSTFSCSPWELSTMYRAGVPLPGQWFCVECCHRNEEKASICKGCNEESPRHQVAWMCTASVNNFTCRTCRRVQTVYATCCPLCQGALDMTCGFCKQTGLNDADGKLETVRGLWYCTGCWAKHNRHTQAMKEQLPPMWFVEGGQNWCWVSGGNKSRMEFDRWGKMQSSWGQGDWWVERDVMHLKFGSEHWELNRTPQGFTATRDRGNGSVREADVASGWPLFSGLAPMHRPTESPHEAENGSPEKRSKTVVVQ